MEIISKEHIVSDKVTLLGEEKGSISRYFLGLTRKFHVGWLKITFQGS